MTSTSTEQAPARAGILAEQIASAFLWNATLIPLGALISFAISVLIARELQLAQFPAYAVLIAFKDSLLLFGDLGLGQGISRYVPMARLQGGRAAVVRLVLQVLAARFVLYGGTAVAVLAAAGATCSQLHLEPGEAASFLLWIPLLALLESLSTTLCYLLWSLLEQKWVNLVNLLDAVLQPALVLAAILQGLRLPGIVLAFVVAAGLRAALMGLAAARSLAKLELVAEPPTAGSDAAVQLSGPVTFSRVLRLGLLSFADKSMRYFLTPPFLVLLLNRSLPREQVAIFALGIDLIFKVAATASSGAQGWVVPLLASAHDRQDRARLQFAYAGTVQLLSALLLPAGFLFLAVAGAVIPLLYGEAFSGAARILWLLGPSLLLEFSISAPALAACYAAERLRFFLGVGAAMAVLSIGSGLAGAWLGLDLVCALLGAIRLAGASAVNVYVNVTQGLRFPTSFVLKLLVVSAVAAWALPASPARWLPVMLHTVAGGLVLLVAIKLVRPLTAGERSSMRDSGIRGARLIARFL